MILGPEVWAGCAALAGALGAHLGLSGGASADRDQPGSGLLVLWFDAEPQQGSGEFVEALSGRRPLSETRGLIRAQRLFEAFIQMPAGAIDAKSPRHRRPLRPGAGAHQVARLRRLRRHRRAVQKDLLGDDDWEVVHIAAWLHDCGKVATIYRRQGHQAGAALQTASTRSGCVSR